jgi:hypothetical protein
MYVFSDNVYEQLSVGLKANELDPPRRSVAANFINKKSKTFKISSCNAYD